MAQPRRLGGSPEAGLAGSNPGGGTSFAAGQRLFPRSLATACHLPAICTNREPARCRRFSLVTAPSEPSTWPCHRQLSEDSGRCRTRRRPQCPPGRVLLSASRRRRTGGVATHTVPSTHTAGPARWWRIRRRWWPYLPATASCARGVQSSRSIRRRSWEGMAPIGPRRLKPALDEDHPHSARPTPARASCASHSWIAIITVTKLASPQKFLMNPHSPA